MSVTVRVPTTLRTLTAGESTVTVEGATVSAVLDDLEAGHPGFKSRLLDDDGSLRKFVNVFVADDDVRFMDGLDTPVPDGETLSIVPAVAVYATTAPPMRTLCWVTQVFASGMDFSSWVAASGASGFVSAARVGGTNAMSIAARPSRRVRCFIGGSRDQLRESESIFAHPGLAGSIGTSADRALAVTGASPRRRERRARTRDAGPQFPRPGGRGNHHRLR